MSVQVSKGSRWMALAWLVAGLPDLTGCSGIPSWVRMPPADPEFVYAVGMKTGAGTVEEGQRSAVYQAVTQVVEQFGIRSMVQFQERRTAIETTVLDEIRSASERAGVRVRGAVVAAMHVATRRQSAQDVYDVYVLLRYPTRELQQERARLLQAATERRLFIRRCVEAGQQYERRGEVSRAVEGYVAGINAAIEAEEPSDRVTLVGYLRNLLARIRLRPMPESGGQGVSRIQTEHILAARAVLTQETGGLPVADLPVSFWLQDLDRRQFGRAVTDREGIARWALPTLYGLGREVEVSAAIDVAALRTPVLALPKTEQQSVVPLLDGLEAEVVTFRLKMEVEPKGLRVRVTMHEEFQGRPVTPHVVTPVLTQRLREAGYDVYEMEEGSSAGPPDLVVKGTSLARTGHAGLAGVHAGRASGDIQAVDPRTGRVLVRVFREETGVGAQEQEAGQQALRALGDTLARDLLAQLGAGMGRHSDSHQDLPVQTRTVEPGPNTQGLPRSVGGVVEVTR